MDSIDQIKDVDALSVEAGAQTVIQASQAQRFFTLLLDWFFCYCCGFLAGFVLAMSGLQNYARNADGFVLGTIIFLTYYIAQEALFGKTLGKRIMGTKVVSTDGSKLSLGQVISRTLCRFIPFEAFTFLGNKGVPYGWHDKIPKTKVITTRRT